MGVFTYTAYQSSDRMNAPLSFTLSHVQGKLSFKAPRSEVSGWLGFHWGWLSMAGGGALSNIHL